VVSREREICRRYGAMGLWDLAATVAEHNATLRRTMGYIDDMDFAVVLAGAGKEEISRKHVEHVVRRWREEHADKPVKKQFIRTSLLFTPPVMDAEECIACASRESENNPQSYFSRFCLALARYRASRHLDALHGIEADPVHTSWDSLSGEGSKLAAAYLYGLAAHDAGRKEVALAQLGRAETLYQNTCKAQLATEREPFSIYFWDLAAAQLLRREAWRKVREQEPPCVPWWHLVQGRGYRLLGESQRAEEEFAAAVAAAPDDPDVWLARAAVFEQVGDAARADTDRKKALELAPDDPRCWIRLVEAHVRRGEYEQANAGLAQVQSLQPKPGTELDLADVRFTLGQAYWDKDRLPEAHQLWQAVLGELHHVALENPEDQALQQRVGTCEREICGRYGAMGLWDLAATVARHNAALRRVTNYTDDADFAVVLAAADGQEAAREYFGHLVRQLGEQHPGDPLNAQQIRTNLLLHPPVIDAEDCIALASNLVEGDPNRYFLQFCLALAQYRASQYAEALKTIESNSLNASWEATSGESNKPGNAYLYALAAQGGDRKEDALAQLERAEGIYQDTCKLQLDGDRKELTEPLCRWFWNLATAQLLRREAWQKIKGQSPPADPWWHLIQARGYGLIGESERAEKELAAAVAAASDAPEVWVARARVFELLGETARAEADRNKAVQVGGGKEAGGVKTPKE
jgi:tetratricopeptide (TPR) repeat protein